MVKVSTFRGKVFRLSSLSMMLVVCFSQPRLVNYCIMKGCWILLNAFSASIEIIIRFFSFILLVWCVTLIDFCMLNHFCIPRINSTWLWRDFFYYGIGNFVNFCINIHQYSQSILICSFLVRLLSDYGIRVNASLIK